MGRGGTTWPRLLAICTIVLCQTALAGGHSGSSPDPSADPSVTIGGTIVVGDVDRRTIAAALERLPRRPKRVVMVGPGTVTPDLQRQMRDLDAFVPIGSDVIYLRRESPTVREAELSGGPYLFMLVVIIWHEMAHGDGLDEPQARRREEELWKQFVQRGEVESGVGMTYLAELRRRK
jgi:hypothetical protein